MRPSRLLVIAALLACASPTVLAAQERRTEVRTVLPSTAVRDTLVLRTLISGNEAEVMRVVNELRSREARILNALSRVPFERVAERRELEEELARISREAFAVMSVIESRCLEEKSTAPAGYLGVNITSEVQVQDRIVTVHRSVITSVEPGSPAESAGLRSGDRLVSIAGRDARERLPELAGVLEPGRRVTVRVERDGSERDFGVLVAPRPQRWNPGCPRFERAMQPLRMGGVARVWMRDSTTPSGERYVFITPPSPEAAPAPPTATSPATPPTPASPPRGRVAAVSPAPGTPPAAPAAPAPMVFAYGTTSGGRSQVAYFAGVQFRELDDDWRNVLGVRAGTEGVLVNEVAPGSAAAASGLKVGDVVTSVNGTAATSPLVVVRLLSLDDDREVPLRILRSRDARTVTFRWGPSGAPR